MSRLVQQLLALVEALRAQGVRHAAIGGVAVVAHGVVRATQDLDFLVDANDALRIDTIMTGLGFRCIHSSPDAVNYVSHDLRVDFLLAHRPPARALLASARTLRAFDQDLTVVDVEGIVGLKLQALVNDPRREQDRMDIRTLLRAHRKELDLDRLRTDSMPIVKPSDPRPRVYFAASGGVDTRDALPPRDPFEAFDELMELVEGLLPGPPPRRPLGPDGPLRL